MVGDFIEVLDFVRIGQKLKADMNVFRTVHMHTYCSNTKEGV